MQKEELARTRESNNAYYEQFLSRIESITATLKDITGSARQHWEGRDAYLRRLETFFASSRE